MKTLPILAVCGLLLAASPMTAQEARAAKPAAPAEQDAKEADEPSKPPYELGSVVDPKITLADIDGKKHVLGKYRGKIVVLNFWSQKCPISRGYDARLQEIYEEFSRKGVVFLMLNPNNRDADPVTEDEKDPYRGMRSYMKENELTFPMLIDEDHEVADMFQAKTTPHVYVLDEKGKVRYTGNIDSDYNWRVGKDEAEPYLANALDDLLAGDEVATKSTRPWGCTIKRVKKPAKVGNGGQD